MTPEEAIAMAETFIKSKSQPGNVMLAILIQHIQDLQEQLAASAQTTYHKRNNEGLWEQGFWGREVP